MIVNLSSQSGIFLIVSFREKVLSTTSIFDEIFFIKVLFKSPSKDLFYSNLICIFCSLGFFTKKLSIELTTPAIAPPRAPTFAPN